MRVRLVLFLSIEHYLSSCFREYLSKVKLLVHDSWNAVVDCVIKQSKAKNRERERKRDPLEEKEKTETSAISLEPQFDELFVAG